MAILIASGFKDSQIASLGHRQEMMGMCCGANGVDCYLEIPIRAVLESNRTRQSGCQFPV